jgi:hypothetical protein
VSHGIPLITVVVGLIAFFVGFVLRAILGRDDMREVADLKSQLFAEKMNVHTERDMALKLLHRIHAAKDILEGREEKETEEAKPMLEKDVVW